MKLRKTPKVIIIGGGFGGINLAKGLANAPVEIILIDKNNYHTFQPLLYQVAIGAIEGDSVGFPIRRIFTNQANFRFLMAEVEEIIPNKKLVNTSMGPINYDHLVIATGSDSNFFGNKSAKKWAMPMKSITEALNIRNLILQNLEAVSFTDNVQEKMALMTFVVVGGGPTGVELAGALAELRTLILMKDYHDLKSSEMTVYLIEGKSELLAAMSNRASAQACEYLKKAKVKTINGVHVESYDGFTLKVDNGKVIETRNVFWTAGVNGKVPQGLPASAINEAGRVMTDEYHRVNGYDEIYAIGDAAAMITDRTPEGHPGIAPAAIQQGQHLARNLQNMLNGSPTTPFRYRDKGSLATIGRNKAVADFGKIFLRGFFAWVLWGAVHIMSIAGFTSKGSIFLNWVINYINRNSDNRLIIGGIVSFRKKKIVREQVGTPTGYR